ncbi:MAG: hypothetical protein IPK66_06980 [Rhodospirillales bacterium]|nr:hypothetical protein [Rhodospirillales bacterium]
MRGDDEGFIDEQLYLAEIDSLTGVAVFSPSGTKLGALGSAVVSRRSQTITYVILTRTRLLGLRRERYIVPASALTPSSEHGGFVLDLATSATVGTSKPATEPAAPERLDPARDE